MATSFKKVENNGQSTLNADITTTVQTTVQINPSHPPRFPSSGDFWIRVYNNVDPQSATQSELMLVTGVSSNTFTVTRNADGLGAYTFSTGQAVRLNIMAEHIEDLATAVNTIENKLDGTTDPSLVTLKEPTIANIIGGGSNTNGHTVPNLADDTFTLNAAQQTLSNKTHTSPLFQGTVDGWISANETWTYLSRTQAYTNDPAAGINITLNMTNTIGFVVGSSVTVSSSAGSETAIVASVVANTSITVDYLSLNHTTSSPLVTLNNAFSITGDVTSKYQAWDKFKYTQTTVKYGYSLATVYDSSNTRTIIQLNAGSDYSVANAAITSPYYSKTARPQGFPAWFNYIPKWLSTSTPPAIVNGTLAGNFVVEGKTCVYRFYWAAGSSTTYGAGDYKFSLPAPRKVNATFGSFQRTGVAVYRDASAVTGAQCYCFMFSSENNFTFSQYNSGTAASPTVPVTWAQSDQIWGDLVYEAAD
jgi:hypothetical protein